jgi:pilus assembly protein Flp/PilA
MHKYNLARERLGKHWSRIMRELFLRFFKSESAATAIEYALIASGISIVILAAVTSIGDSLNTTFASVSTQLK